MAAIILPEPVAELGASADLRHMVQTHRPDDRAVASFGNRPDERLAAGIVERALSQELSRMIGCVRKRYRARPTIDLGVLEQRGEPFRVAHRVRAENQSASLQH